MGTAFGRTTGGVLRDLLVEWASAELDGISSGLAVPISILRQPISLDHGSGMLGKTWRTLRRNEPACLAKLRNIAIG